MKDISHSRFAAFTEFNIFSSSSAPTYNWSSSILMFFLPCKWKVGNLH